MDELRAVLDYASTPEVLGTTIMIGNSTVPVPCVATHSAYLTDVMPGLLLEDVDMIVTVSKTFVTERPAPQSTVTLDGVVRRVLKVEDDDACYNLILGAVKTRRV